MPDLEHIFYKTNGIWLHTVAAGPKDGPLLIFLHGFPEFWYAWSEQIPFFAAQGFRVLAPDQRGYNLSDRPHGAAAYRVDELSDDICDLIRAAGHEKAVIVGHDWGGVVAWWLARHHPDRLEKLVIINAPHWAAFKEDLRQNPAQWLRSAYMAFFQIPRLPEALCRIGNWLPVMRSMRRTSRLGAFRELDFRQYRRAWSQPGAFTAMLNWYRAAFLYPPQQPADPFISTPTLILWGCEDAFLGSKLARLSRDRCRRARLVIFRRATHWVHKEEADQVNHLIHAFITP